MAERDGWWTVLGKYRQVSSGVFWMQYVKAASPEEAVLLALRREHARQGWEEGRKGFTSPIEAQFLFEGKVAPFESEDVAESCGILRYDQNYPRLVEEDDVISV